LELNVVKEKVMKLRTGFVSNSSTSSFLMYGAMVDKYDLEEMLAKDKVKEIDEANLPSVDDGEEEEEEFDVYEALDTLFEGRDIDVEIPYGYDEDNVYIGRSWDKVKDDQTGREFKTEIEQIVRELIGKKIKLKFETHEAAWHD
jgi:hypothetical protein